MYKYRKIRLISPPMAHLSIDQMKTRPAMWNDIRLMCLYVQGLRVFMCNVPVLFYK